MIDFAKVKSDKETGRLYHMARGERGRFEKVFLTDSEAIQYYDHVGGNAQSNKGPGPCPSGEHGISGDYGVQEGPCDDVSINDVIPTPIESGIDLDVPPGMRVARRAVSLIDSMSHLSTALFHFGAIDTNEVGYLRDHLEILHTRDVAETVPCDRNADELPTAYEFVRHIADQLYYAYTKERSMAPLKVVGYHAAPVITLAQYLMGLVFPEGDMLGRAVEEPLLNRGECGVTELTIDINTVYNNIQADISEAGRQLLGQAPDEIGDVGIRDQLSLIEYVTAVDEMMDFLSTRMDFLTEMLNSKM